MDVTSIIANLYHSHFVEKYAWQFMGVADIVNRDDIIQELYLMICEVDGALLCGAFDKGGMNAVRGYISGLIIRQLRSDNSKIFKKYTRHVYREKPMDDFSRWHNVSAKDDFWSNRADC